MNDDQASWKQRHIAAFRTHRGHQVCTVQGCTGSQPLMWVPTATEDGEVAALEAEVIILSKQVKIALEARTAKPFRRGPDHIHWTT